MFSDSLEEEEDEFCDESTFMPKPTEDKATSTYDTYWTHIRFPIMWHVDIMYRLRWGGVASV